MDDARALLNSLMGSDRDARPEQRRVRKFTDDGICRNYLMGLCPNDLFKNTKIDLGACSKEHNEHLKETFEADGGAPRYRRKWRGGLRVQLKSLLDAVDRRIGQNQIRIAREKEGGPGATEEQKKQLAALKEEVSEKLKQAEHSADEGRFEESRKIISDAEAVKRRLEDLEVKRYEKYRKENICDVCGLIIDAQEAEDMKTGRGWHSNGKQHIGYTRIRETLKQLDEEQAQDRKNAVATPTPSPVRAPRPEMKRRKSTSRSRDAKGTTTTKVEPRRRRSKSKSRARPRKREATTAESPKRPPRKPDRRRPNSRSPSRRRSGSRRKRSRSKSRSATRSRSRHRPRSRSRSRSRRKKSRSKDRRRSHSKDKKRDKRRSRSTDSDQRKKAKRASKKRAKSEEGEDDTKAGSTEAKPGDKDAVAGAIEDEPKASSGAGENGGDRDEDKEPTSPQADVDDLGPRPRVVFNLFGRIRF